MPFTYSHPALLIPLFKKRRFSVTGLIIGSMVPDFEYFIRLDIQSLYSHTLWGMFWFDIPLAILLCFLFHSVVRNPLIKNLPSFFQSRFESYTLFHWNLYFIKNSFWILLSVLIGAFSHIFWDAFTHKSGFFVQKITLLQHSFFIVGMEVHLYTLLQHLSSLIGAIILLWYIRYKMPVSAVNNNNNNNNNRPFGYAYWLILFTFVLLMMSVIYFAGISFTPIASFIICGMSSFNLGLLLTPLLLKLKK